MEKNFLNLKNDQKRVAFAILFGGMFVSVILGIQAAGNRKLTNGYELLKNKAGDGSYEQTVVTKVEEEEISLTIEVEEQLFTEEKAEELLQQAAAQLDQMLLADNPKFSQISSDLCFPDTIPGCSVNVQWIDKLPDYFYSDGTLREDVVLEEAVEQKVSAVLSCQKYVQDYERLITLIPRKITLEQILTEQIQTEETKLMLPKSYQGQQLQWKKPMDHTFLYFGCLTLAAVIFLWIGGRRDKETSKKQWMEAIDRDYAQIVSKFAMLLSAGLSVRNAWERIVMLDQEGAHTQKAVYIEMNRSVQELHKGVSELEVYERFGVRVGLIHYKKLMALFISDKKRGSVKLLEAMNEEMMQAWEEQKRKTRQQGEKTGTKLLIPMMGMLAVVFIMIMVPAFLSFQ